MQWKTAWIWPTSTAFICHNSTLSILAGSTLQIRSAAYRRGTILRQMYHNTARIRYTDRRRASKRNPSYTSAQGTCHSPKSAVSWAAGSTALLGRTAADNQVAFFISGMLKFSLFQNKLNISKNIYFQTAFRSNFEFRLLKALCLLSAFLPNSLIFPFYVNN